MFFKIIYDIEDYYTNFEIATQELSLERNSREVLLEIIHSPFLLQKILTLASSFKDTMNTTKNKKRFDIIELYSRHFRDNIPKINKRKHINSFNQTSFQTKKSYFKLPNEEKVIQELVINLISKELIKVSAHLSIKFNKKKQKKNFLLSNPIYKIKLEQESRDQLEKLEREKREKEVRDNSISRRSVDGSHVRSRSQLYPE